MGVTVEEETFKQRAYITINLAHFFASYSAGVYVFLMLRAWISSISALRAPFT